VASNSKDAGSGGGWFASSNRSWVNPQIRLPRACMTWCVSGSEKPAERLGVNDQLSVVSAIAVVPIFCWELSLGLWLAIRGFADAPAGAAPVLEPAR